MITSGEFNVEHFLDVDHYRFHYYSSGQSTRPAIVFLHGFLGNCREFSPVIALLSHQFYCLAIDLPGHGKTKTLDGDHFYEMPFTAEGVIQWIKALNIKPCFLIGYSMGGRLASYLTLHFPAYFLKVVLESASLGLKTQAERVERLHRDFKLAQRLETENFASFLTQWYTQPLFASLQAQPNFEHTLNQRLHNNPLQLAKSLRYLGTGYQPSLWEKFKHNAVPTLLLAGELDEKFVEINAEIAQLSEFVTFRVMSQSGHNIHLEQPSLFVQSVQQFLA